MSEAEKRPRNSKESTEENFAELLNKNENIPKPKKYSEGQKIKARVVRISEEWVFVDVGGNPFHILRLNIVLLN